jgi:hypothetical protein
VKKLELYMYILRELVLMKLSLV